MIKLDRLTKGVELVAHTAVVVGLVLAVLGYLSEKNARREQFTVEYSRAYDSEYLQASRTRIRGSVRSIENALPNYRISNSAIAEILVKQINEGGVGSPEADVLAVAEYFNGALSCVEADLCDDDLIKRLHANEAASLACLILPALDVISLRGGQTEMKRGILHFRSEAVDC